MSETSGYYQDMLREQGYINLDFPISGADIDPLFEQFREFIAIGYGEDELPNEFVKALSYEVPGRPTDASYRFSHQRIGVENPDEPGRGASTDDKDLAHIGPRSLTIAQERLGKRMPAIMRQFITTCRELHEVTKTTVRPA